MLGLNLNISLRRRFISKHGFNFEGPMGLRRTGIPINWAISAAKIIANADIFLRVVKYMMASSNGNIFRVTGHLCGEFTGHRWIPCTKASNAELWCFLWSAPWINGWANNREAGDLIRHRTRYDVIVMKRSKTRVKYLFIYMVAKWTPVPCKLYFFLLNIFQNIDIYWRMYF